MQRSVLLVLAALVALALAEGQFYVPRSYYIIDAEGHESIPVPLRRLRRSLAPYPYGGGASANANANANAEANGWGDANASANANANAQAGSGGWGRPAGYGSGNPLGLRLGETRRQYGPVHGQGVSASTSVGLDSSGTGYYDQTASVSG